MLSPKLLVGSAITKTPSLFRSGNRGKSSYRKPPTYIFLKANYIPKHLRIMYFSSNVMNAFFNLA
jgi:hypothetical protein